MLIGAVTAMRTLTQRIVHRENNLSSQAGP